MTLASDLDLAHHGSPPKARTSDARTLEKLRAAAAHCRACALYKRSTPTVFGAGPSRSRVVLVGEQPGNEEDLAGKPFVGAAGRLLERALNAARIDRSQVYVTIVVKRFKSVPGGKRRIHMRPNQSEIEACRPWLDTEVLRAPDDVTRHAELERLIDDLEVVAPHISALPAARRERRARPRSGTAG